MEKVKNVIKDILFLLVLIIIFKTVISYQLAKTEYQTYDYLVTSGDTLWSIAVDICENNNDLYIKNVVNDIKDINDMKSPNIYKGQTIKLPIYN